MNYAKFLAFIAPSLIVGATNTTLAAPVLLAESSAFYAGDSFSDSDGPVVAVDPSILYEAFTSVEDFDAYTAAGAFGDTVDGITLFETDAYAVAFDGGVDGIGGGSAGATSTFTLSDTITNSGAFSDTAFLSFHIDEWSFGVEHTSAESSASVSAEIFIDGEAIWSFTAGITSSGGAASPFLTGFGPGPLPSQTCEGDFDEEGFTSCYNELSYAGLLDLGMLAPGESVDFTYVLSSTVFLEDILESGGVDAYINDPTEGFFAGVGPIPGSSSVPAPGGLALISVGMLGLVSLRRKTA